MPGVGIEPLPSASTGSQVQLTTPCLTAPDNFNSIFFISIFSLESKIAANPNIAMLVVDPISAFYWSDRACDLQSTFLHKNMAAIAKILTKISKSNGVFVAVTTQLLMKPKDKGQGQSMTLCQRSRTWKEVKGQEDYVEYLGKSWKECVTHRFRKC